MDQQALQAAIKKAKQSHMVQLDRIDCLIRGIPVSTDPTPVSQKECLFGTWLYGNEPQLRELIFNQNFEEIERLHTLWHEEYARIHQVFYPETQGLLSKFMGKKQSASEQARERAKVYFNDLKNVTEQLIRKVESIEKRINALPASKFK